MSARAILPQAVYRRAQEPRQLANDVRLTALEWALYFGADGTRTLAELGRQFRAEAADRDRALVRLLDLALVVERELGASEYVRALAAAGDSEQKTLHEFLTGTLATNTEPPRSPLRDGRSPVAAKFPRIAPPLGFTPLPSPNDHEESRLMSASRKLSLRALMNLIETQAGSREAGQLDIYRVFVRVDTSLLKRSGIETLRFTEDRLVSDPELEQAIVRSVKKTLGVDCPDSLWVA
ncbi:MAG TPA: hypothetical protein VHW00_25220 [Thermoanaerobaculia bacterium]|nr:hypothetical protein [Thermoanaerobaculia bacterium]